MLNFYLVAKAIDNTMVAIKDLVVPNGTAVEQKPPAVITPTKSSCAKIMNSCAVMAAPRKQLALERRSE
jgi:hypothetical protein